MTVEGIGHNESRTKSRGKEEVSSGKRPKVKRDISMPTHVQATQVSGLKHGGHELREIGEAVVSGRGGCNGHAAIVYRLCNGCDSVF